MHKFLYIFNHSETKSTAVVKLQLDWLQEIATRCRKFLSNQQQQKKSQASFKWVNCREFQNIIQ